MGTQLLEDYSKISYMGSWRLFDIDFNITSKKITKTNLFNIFFFLISNYLVYETTIQHVFPIHSDRERNQYIILNDQYIHTYVTLYMIILPSMRKSTVWFQLNWHIFHLEISAYQTIRFWENNLMIAGKKYRPIVIISVSCTNNWMYFDAFTVFRFLLSFAFFRNDTVIAVIKELAFHAWRLWYSAVALCTVNKQLATAIILNSTMGGESPALTVKK